MSILSKIESIQNEFNSDISYQIKDLSDLDSIINKYLGRKGLISSLFDDIKDINKKERPIIGKKINQLRKSVELRIEEEGKHIEAVQSEQINFDLSLPGDTFLKGSLHPITQVMDEICDIFGQLGFSIFSGNEVENEYYNFEALNIPKHHPARDMQDTFYLNNNQLLRTHTSPSQIHFMEKHDPPIKVISPGRVYRNEDISVRSYCLFHQIEGLCVDEDIKFSHLKGLLEYFSKIFFGDDIKIRFRPSYFPFTEPSAEMDIYWGLENESDYRITKGTGWLEILGCGMVNQQVFNSVGFKPNTYTGYAFGIGIERIAMLRYGIDDIRLLYDGDIRFLRQF